jgi:hypothetical protein
MNFVNVGGPDGVVNTGSAPVLAIAFSDVFHVFSAKKFPGVIESTNLSKCFATQGGGGLSMPFYGVTDEFINRHQNSHTS